MDKSSKTGFERVKREREKLYRAKIEKERAREGGRMLRK